MKSETKAATDHLRNSAWKMVIAIIEDRFEDAKREAENVVILINHLRKESQR